MILKKQKQKFWLNSCWNSDGTWSCIKKNSYDDVMTQKKYIYILNFILNPIISKGTKIKS